jgi:hypothetical protein
MFNDVYLIGGRTRQSTVMTVQVVMLSFGQF